MEKISIANKILSLRKKRNFTQENLANMIGVSKGAVSKWENGNSMPDILLLPPLARALNVSIDEILSFEVKLTEEEVRNIKSELIETFLHKSYDTGEQLCHEYLKQYPNSNALKYEVATVMNMYLVMAEKSDDEFINSKCGYSLKLLREVADSNDYKYKLEALFAIAMIELNMENYKESEEALKKLPKNQVDATILYSQLYIKQGKKEEAEKLCRGKLMSYIIHSNANLITLSRIAASEKNYEKSIFYLEVAHKIQKQFGVQMGSAAWNYCILYIKLENKVEAARWFKIYVDELLNKPYDYEKNKFFKGYELEVNSEGQKVVRKKAMESLLNEEKLQVLAGIKEYEEAIKKIENQVTSNITTS